MDLKLLILLINLCFYCFLSNVLFYKTVYGLLPRITWITPFILFINACFQRYSWLPNENINLSKGLKVLSPFNGISCGRVALERAGIKVERYVSYEIDDDANKVAKYNYPDDEYNGDVFEADFTQYEGFDLLIGGSPCTYWSIAKAGNNGEKGERETTASGLGWDLFSQYVRALKEAKPKYFLYENNASMSDEIRECISKELGCKPIEIDSADFSAQHRHRLYWTNIPIEEWTKSELVFDDIVDTDTPYKYRNFEKYKDTVKVSKDGLSVRFDTSGKGQYGQANRAKKTNQKWNTLPASGQDKNDVWVDDYISRHITPIEAERLQTLPDNYTEILSSEAKRTKVCGNGWTVDVIAHIFSSLKR